MGRFGRVGIVVAVILLAVPAAVGAQEAEAAADDERAAVLEAVEGVLRAITDEDPELARRWSLPDVRLQGTPPATDVPLNAAMSREGFTGMLASAAEDLVERIWSPEVRIRGRIAQVWAPYDFWVDGTFSHCGVDAFHLVRTVEGWRVAAITWTQEQPPACETHPDGPP